MLVHVLAEQVDLQDTDDDTTSFGQHGLAFEEAFLKAADMLNLQYEHSVGRKMIDLRTKGNGWARIIGGRDVNIKVFRTRWLFQSRRLAKILPWTPAQWDLAVAKHGDAEAVLDYVSDRVKRSLVRRKLMTIMWTRPKTTQVEHDLIAAVQDEDVEAVKKLMVRKNFESFKFADFNVRARESRGSLGSVALLRNGRVIARTEYRARQGRAPYVVFKTEAAPRRQQHRVKSRESVRSASASVGGPGNEYSANGWAFDYIIPGTKIGGIITTPPMTRSQAVNWVRRQPKIRRTSPLRKVP